MAVYMWPSCGRCNINVYFNSLIAIIILYTYNECRNANMQHLNIKKMFKNVHFQLDNSETNFTKLF